MAQVSNSPTPTQALRDWAKANWVNPAMLTRKVGFSPAYAWALLNGDKRVTPETVNTLALAFGTDSLKAVYEALKLAGR